MNKDCKNCGTALAGNYCSDCGQSGSVCRINFHSIIHEFLHGVLHVDKGVFYTMKELTLRPGVALRDYLDGKRIRFFKPFSYLFILSTVYIVLMQFLKISIADISVQSAGTQSGDEELARVAENLTSMIINFINNHYALISLLILPVMALCTFILFRKSRFNYGEHLIINSYISGHMILLSIILMPFSYLFRNWTSLSSLLTYILAIYMYVKVFDNYKLYSGILRSLFSYIIVIMLIGILTVISMALFTAMYY